MALREITFEGTRWTVWSVTPTLSSSSLENGLRGELAEGWLAAKCGAERRRIVPIPAGWEEWSDAQLIQALRRVEPLPVRE